MKGVTPAPAKPGRRGCAAQAFSRSENLEIAGIHFRRFEIDRGPPSGLPDGEEHGMTPSDLIEQIPYAMKELS